MSTRSWLRPVLVFAATLFALSSAAAPPPASPEAALRPLREGTVRSHVEEPLYSYLTVVDDEQRVFYVVSSLCRVEPGQRVRVLEATHYPRMRVPPLGGAVKDVYLALVLELDGRRVNGFTADSMIPQGCMVLE